MSESGSFRDRDIHAGLYNSVCWSSDIDNHHWRWELQQQWERQQLWEKQHLQCERQWQWEEQQRWELQQQQLQLEIQQQLERLQRWELQQHLKKIYAYLVLLGWGVFDCSVQEEHPLMRESASFRDTQAELYNVSVSSGIYDNYRKTFYSDEKLAYEKYLEHLEKSKR